MHKQPPGVRLWIILGVNPAPQSYSSDCPYQTALSAFLLPVTLPDAGGLPNC